MLQCGVCRTSFLCTMSKDKLQEHVTSKHPKSTFEVCLLGATLHAWHLMEAAWADHTALPYRRAFQCTWRSEVWVISHCSTCSTKWCCHKRMPGPVGKQSAVKHCGMVVRT